MDRAGGALSRLGQPAKGAALVDCPTGQKFPDGMPPTSPALLRKVRGSGPRLGDGAGGRAMGGGAAGRDTSGGRKVGRGFELTFGGR